MLSFKLLGSIELLKNGVPLRAFRSQKEAAMLIYLAHTGQPQQRDVLAELLWNTSNATQALSNLRTALARLQKQFDNTLTLTQRTVSLAADMQCQVDSIQLLNLLATIGPIDSIETATTLQQALQSYGGDFLADFHLRNASGFDQWQITTREHIHREVSAAYQKLGSYVLSVPNPEFGTLVARRWLQIDALDEAANALIIQLLLEQRKPCEAATHYDQYAALLHKELGLEPAEATAALIKGHKPKQSSPPYQPVSMHHNLPAAHDQFFGRQDLQQAIQMRLNQQWCRLLTIVGPGGMGKTRLARLVAQHRLQHYADGVWLVELADLDPNDENLSEAIVVEIAAALDLRFSGTASPTEQVLNYLQHKHLLLILDNFEHLLAGLQIVIDIMQRCEQVQLLVTSRESLNIQAEWIVALSGLSYPASALDQTPTDAVQLFVARLAQHSCEVLSDDDVLAIRSICRMVEGLPLAIELAAAQTRHASPRSIAERMQQGFDALRPALRDRPPRHHNLQIVFDMSWHSLTPILQERLASLTIFRGGFSAIAAQQIAEADAQLMLLCEKSLLSYDRSTDRYALHPVIRAYAAEKLQDSNQIQSKHALYYLGLLAEHSQALQKDRPQDSIAVLEADIENIRMAWNTGLSQAESELLLAALPSLSIYYQLRGLALEAEAVMHTSIDTAMSWQDKGQILAIRAGLERVRFLNRLGRYWPAMQAIQVALKLADGGRDQWAEAMAHVLWAESLWRLGEYETARKKLAYALGLAQNHDYMLIIGWCQHHLGIIDDIQGLYDKALKHIQQSCTIWQQLENTGILCVSLNSLGLIYYHLGNLAAAQLTMEQALELCKRLDSRHLQALQLNNLSMIATEQNDYNAAQKYLEQGLALAIASANLTTQAEIYLNMGKNYHLLNEIDAAIDYLQQGLQIAEELGNRSLIAFAMLHMGNVKQKQGYIQQTENLYSHALHITQQDNLAQFKCEILIGQAELWIQSKPAQAHQARKAAIELASSLGNPELIKRANALKQSLPMELDRNERNLSA